MKVKITSFVEKQSEDNSKMLAGKTVAALEGQ
jgi:hypothetical protein